MFVNWSRRSGATLTDMLFNKICNKTEAYNPFSKTTKKMILFELFETDPQTQCKECWREGHNSQGYTIVSCEILIFVNPCLYMIEMKTFVSNGTILQNKISPIEWRNQNIFDTNKIGGSLSISLETKDH